MADVKVKLAPEVEQLQSLLHDQPGNPMRPNVKDYHQEELARLTEIIKAPAFIQADRGFATEKRRRIQKMLDEQAPKRIEEPLRQEAVAKLADRVLRDVIRPAMLTQEEMRRNPVGAVDGFLRRENARPIKIAVQTYKRAMWALDPDNPDMDYTNMERHRPQTPVTPGAATFMANAQIPGNFAQTPLAKDHWPLGEPTADTALKQVRRKQASQKALKIRWARRDAKLAALARRDALKQSAVVAPPEG